MRRVMQDSVALSIYDLGCRESKTGVTRCSIALSYCGPEFSVP